MRHFNSRHFHRGNTPLSEDAMRQLAPSIFADAAHESRSARYTYIPTINVLRGMQNEGFLPVAVRQSRTSDETKTGYTKHMIRFRRPDAQAKAVGDTVPEIVLVNSHDGSSAYNLMAGLFRLVCLNGLMVADKNLSSVKVPHKGDIIGKVIEGSYTVLQDATRALEAPAQWSQLRLAPPERDAFAEAAHVLRFADAEGNVETPIKPAQLLMPRRYDDAKDDLWTTFNVIQENAIRGGISAMGRDANGRPRRSTTREVRGIDQDVKLNKALWTLAAKMAELKA